MNSYGFINLGRIRRAHNDIVSTIRVAGRPEDTDEEGNPRHSTGPDRPPLSPPLPGDRIPHVDLEMAAIPFEGGLSRPHPEYSQPNEREDSRQEEETSESSFSSRRPESSMTLGEDEDDEPESLEIMVDPTREELEQLHYEELSPDFNVMVNARFNPREDYNSVEMWELLHRLALPETKRYLIRYVRHCTFVAEQWLVRILQWHNRRSSRRASGERCPAIPPDFEETLRPMLEDIVRKVRHRRWRCSVSKKYIDSLCMYTLCPTFTYDVVHDREEKRGQLRVHISNRLPGDPFRRVSKEINVSRDESSESLELVPLLWQLELRLIALLYMDSDWINNTTTVRCFPQLCDSRVLFSIYRKQECDRPILSYNISQIRSALGRLYHRWNDLAPSQDLYHYFCFLRDRVALLSFSSLQSTIQRKFTHPFASRSGGDGIRRAGGGRGSAAANLPHPRPSHSPPTSRRFADEGQSRSIPMTIDPKYAFGQYVGRNLKATVESVTKSSTDDLDELLIHVHRDKDSETKSNTRKTRITRSSFSQEHSGKQSKDIGEDDKYAMEVEERLRRADERETREERLALSRRIKIYKRLTRKQRLRETISKQISNDRDNAFDAIAEEGDYRTTYDTRIEEESTTSRFADPSLPFLGDTHEEPSIIRKALRKLGEDIFSSSEEGEEYDDDDILSGIARRNDPSGEGISLPPGKKKKKKRAKDDPELSTASGSHAAQVNIAPTDEDFFHNYANLEDGRMYAQLGQMIKDEDICAEVTTHHLIACISNNLSGTSNHPRVLSDIPVHFSDAFLSSLTTDTFLVEKTLGKTNQVKCITRTNDSFLLETHALMSQMEQEIQTWNLLDSLSSERKHDEGHIAGWITHREKEENVWKLSLGLGKDFFTQGDDDDDDDDDEALLEYGIEFERCKIENVLMMCYSFSRGKRNQFISRNVREEAFCHFLNPGEAELLLCVCGLKNSSVVPSIIVSRLRQNDVDRLAKIIDEMTIYGVIEEFANFNHLSIRDRNIASHKHAKHIFEMKCLDGLDDNTPAPRHHDEEARRGSTEDVGTLMRQLMHLSIRGALDVHLEQSLRDGLTPMAEDDAVEDDAEALDKKVEYGIFSNRETLRRMYLHDHNHRFLSPDISVPWQSPRGLIRVIRVLLIRCINFFMKEINHIIDARAFFFNPWMTVRMCNDLSFISLLNLREELLKRGEEDESIVPGNTSLDDGGEDSTLPEEEGESSHTQVPTREDIATLFSTTDDSSEGEEEEATIPLESRDSAASQFVRVPFTSEFASAMRTRMENHCMDFYHRCPVVLHCMTGCFLWHPSACTTEECVGADSLLGLHTWLYHMVRHISIHLIPELLVHNTLYLQSSKSQSWRVSRNQVSEIPGYRFADPILWSEEEKMAAFTQAHSIYMDSSYLDGGMHYTHLLMLLSNMPNFGNRGVYCTLIQHVCTFVVQMNIMLFPHILECFSIHNEGAPTEKSTTLPDTEESVSGEEARRGGRKDRGVRPVDRTVQYYEGTVEEDMEDEFSGIGIFCPRPSTT